jgi:hypothetical protein
MSSSGSLQSLEEEWTSTQTLRTIMEKAFEDMRGPAGIMVFKRGSWNLSVSAPDLFIHLGYALMANGITALQEDKNARTTRTALIGSIPVASDQERIKVHIVTFMTQWVLESTKKMLEKAGDRRSFGNDTFGALPRRVLFNWATSYGLLEAFAMTKPDYSYIVRFLQGRLAYDLYVRVEERDGLPNARFKANKFVGNLMKNVKLSASSEETPYLYNGEEPWPIATEAYFSYLTGFLCGASFALHDRIQVLMQEVNPENQAMLKKVAVEFDSYMQVEDMPLAVYSKSPYWRPFSNE